MSKKKQPSLVEIIGHADTITSFMKVTIEQSREAQDYNNAMLNYAGVIANIAETGTLGEMVDAEIALQNLDLRKATDKNEETFIQQANDAIANFAAALNVYDKLTADPAWYREYAACFLPKNRRHGLPNDDFLQALASQNSREGNRDTSINNLPGEEALFKARRELLTAIVREYTRVQETILAGGAPPARSERTAR